MLDMHIPKTAQPGHTSLNPCCAGSIPVRMKANDTRNEPMIRARIIILVGALEDKVVVGLHELQKDVAGFLASVLTGEGQSKHLDEPDAAGGTEHEHEGRESGDARCEQREA